MTSRACSAVLAVSTPHGAQPQKLSWLFGPLNLMVAGVVVACSGKPWGCWPAIGVWSVIGGGTCPPSCYIYPFPPSQTRLHPSTQARDKHN